MVGADAGGTIFCSGGKSFMSKKWQRGIITQVLTEEAISSNVKRELSEMPDVRPDALWGKAAAFMFHKFAKEL